MTVHTLLATLLVLGTVWPALAVEPLANTEIAKIGKASTVLVNLPDSRVSGSGFCTHPSEFFITNAHVVAPGGRINLVLGSGTRAQKIYSCKVMRTDKELDLALLMVVTTDCLKALTLGSDEQLTELVEIIAFGFPFGSALSLHKTGFPSMSVNTGTITSLRYRDRTLDKIQLVAAVNPGNSGGPVLDRAGHVFGVVVSGVRGSGINFAIPVSQIRRFVSPPIVVLTPPALSHANLGTPVAFSARVMSLLPDAKPPSVELTLTHPGGTDRKLKMERSKENYFVASQPILQPTVDRQLNLSGARSQPLDRHPDFQ